MRKETWDEERARLMGYLRDIPKDPDADLDYALDVLDGKKIHPSRPPPLFKRVIET